MKIACFVLAVSCLMMGCKSDTEAADGNKSIEYHVDGNKYAVVVVQDGLSEDEAKEQAMKKAAEVASEHGYRYFTVDSENEVSVIKSNKQFPSEESMPRNIYYELIQSGNFGREPIRSGDFSTSSMYSGYRILFSCFKDKPSGKAYDVCEFTGCKD